jgi:hypothetical protein
VGHFALGITAPAPWGIKQALVVADDRNVRYGVAVVTAAVGLAAMALALLPFALRHQRPAPIQVFDGSTSVLAVPIAGGVPRELIRLHGQWAFPVAEPDGKSLLIQRPKVPSGVQLWRVSLDGTRRTRVGGIQVFQQLAWSADRTEYAYAGPDALEIARLDGTPVRKLGLSNTIASWNGDYLAGERQTRPASTGYRLDIHVWRVDGRHMWSTRMPFPRATVAVARDGKSVAAVRMHLLELVTPHGRRLLASDASYSATWTPDGRSLLYNDTSGRLVVRDVATGALRVVIRGGRYADYTISPDGRTVYVSRLNDAVSIPK